MKVLVVSAQLEAAPAWAQPTGEPIEVTTLPDIEQALARLQPEEFDAVVLDAVLLRGARSHVRALVDAVRRHAGDAALIALSSAADRGDPQNNLLSPDAVLPRSVPSHVQAQIIYWASERARLGAALGRSDRVLHERERELAQSRARFRDVIERNADAIVVVDPQGTIRFANAAAATLFRTRREELTGTPFGHPMVAGETTELDLLRGGDPRAVEMRVVESEWEGERAYIASLRDITERRQAEDAARRLFREQAARNAAEQAAQRFRFLAEASTLLASSLDHHQTFAQLAQMCVRSLADWVVIYVADERGVLRRLEEAHRDPECAKLVEQLRNRAIDPRGTHPVVEVMRTRTPTLVREVGASELERIAPDPEHAEVLRAFRIASYMIVPLIARDRCLGAIAFVAADSSPRFDEYDLAQVQDLALRAALAVDNSRLYREAQEANRAKTDLLAVISHDLRTPLNAIIGYAELLEMGIPERLSAGTLERVGRMRASARHLLYLMDELLSFARLDTGHDEVRMQEADARAIVDEVVAVVEPLALKRELRLHVNTGDAPIRMHTDPDKLRQILLNLASNAVRYTNSGEVRLSVRAESNARIVIDVADTGIGIDEANLPHVFDPFWQERPTRGEPDGGTGLGLSVVRRLVSLLGGEITVTSVVGDGSTFTVTLPRDAGAGKEVADADIECSPDAAVAGITEA